MSLRQESMYGTGTIIYQIVFLNSFWTISLTIQQLTEDWKTTALYYWSVGEYNTHLISLNNLRTLFLTNRRQAKVKGQKRLYGILS